MKRPTILREAMVATSHPLATSAGVRALERGGNAVDAALAAAAMLCVAEPGHTGIGGDLFAQLWWEGELVGLNGSGRSPAELPEHAVAEESGPRSVTVPGAVRAWADLADRFGKLGLDAALAGAVDAAERGVAATERVAHNWASTDRAPRPAPARGEVYRLPELAAHAPPACVGGAGRVLSRAGGRADRRGVVARRGRSRRSCLGVGRAAAARLSRRRGLRAAAERPGRRRADRARPARGAARHAAQPDRGDEARARRRLRARRGCAAARVSARPGAPGFAALRSSRPIARSSRSRRGRRAAARPTSARSTATATPSR